MYMLSFYKLKIFYVFVYVFVYVCVYNYMYVLVCRVDVYCVFEWMIGNKNKIKFGSREGKGRG